MGTEYEEVGFSFNRSVITGLLREQLGFDGIVCTDWGLVIDAPEPGPLSAARAWGVEHLSADERLLKLLEAGVDQFGGECCTDRIVRLVKSGQITEARIDQSVRRLTPREVRPRAVRAPLCRRRPRRRDPRSSRLSLRGLACATEGAHTLDQQDVNAGIANASAPTGNQGL